VYSKLSMSPAGTRFFLSRTVYNAAGPVDCANVLSNLTSMSDALPEWLGFGDPAFPYDGSLNEMIRASNEACCHSGWPVK